MEERRKNKRTELDCRLVLKRLDSQTEEETGIDVIDVSKTGLGFQTAEVLEKGSVYEIHLTIWTKEVLHAFIEIIRVDKMEDTYSYGSIFIGMSEMDKARIEVYQTVSGQK